MNTFILSTSRLLNRELTTKAYESKPLLQKVIGAPVSYHGIHTSSLLYCKVPSEIKPPEKKQVELADDSFMKRLYKKVFSGVPKSKLKATGYILLTYCSQQQSLEHFFKTFDMPDTFYSWFLVTELHVWMLSCRLMHEEEYGRITRNSMVEALWKDCEMRAKSLADIPSSLRSKQILSLSEEFQAALFIYDEGILGGDKELANALWRRFFLCMREQEENQVPDMEKVALLVNYVRATMKMLDNTDAASLLIRPSIQWVPLETSFHAIANE